MSIKQEISLDSTPETVFKVLTSAQEFAAATGAPAEISSEEGGAFSCFGGQITGRQIKLVPNQTIVQAWRAGPWEDSVYSIVKFNIKKSGTTTNVSLEHSGFPEGGEEHLEAGWHKMYWEPLKAYLT